MLLHDDCELVAFEDLDEPAFYLMNRSSKTVWVVGTPPREALQWAFAEPAITEIIATKTAAPLLAELLADGVPGWVPGGIIVHELREDLRLPRNGGDGDSSDVAFIGPESLAGHAIPDNLLEELQMGAESSLIAASFEHGAPVAFCHAGATTATLWDVSVDTLAGHRRHRHAGRCAAFMIRHMRKEGREPVWQSADDNTPSWKLAAKLGFVGVDELRTWRREADGAGPQR